MGRLYIGTSGFSYDHWREGFYPAGLAKSKWFEYYATQFNSVELNVTFYRLVKEATFKKWYEETPEDFRFAIKGSRFISHQKKLKDCEEAVERFFEGARELKEKLGVVLWQLPGSFRVDLERLENFGNFLKEQSVASKVKHAFEFRDESWFNEEVYDLLRKNHTGLCMADSGGKWPGVEVVTAVFVYLRFHGPAGLYASSYSDEELEMWAKKIRKWLSEGKDVYAYFNNDAQGYAVDNAMMLEALVTNPRAG